MKHVVVTGGAGFIGSHIVDKLILGGYRVTIIDNGSVGRTERVNPEADWLMLDLNDPQLAHWFAAQRPDAVIHHAAQVKVDHSIQDPLQDAETNILGSIRLFEACRRSGIGKVVYASSAAVYGDPAYLGIDERHPIRPLSPYGISKFTPELYLQAFHGLYGLRYTILRYANVYGARQDPSADGGVVAIFLDKALHGDEIVIYGDGDQTRDFVYVEDIAEANMLALHSGDGAICNLGCGQPVTINELVHTIAAVTGKMPRTRYMEPRPGDIRHSYLQASAAQEHLGWTPRHSLESGLRLTLAAMLAIEQRGRL